MIRRDRDDEDRPTRLTRTSFNISRRNIHCSPVVVVVFGAVCQLILALSVASTVPHLLLCFSVFYQFFLTRFQGVGSEGVTAVQFVVLTLDPSALSHFRPLAKQPVDGRFQQVWTRSPWLGRSHGGSEGPRKLCYPASPPAK